MRRSKDEFLTSSLAQIVMTIDMYADEMQMQAAAMNNEDYCSKYFSAKEEVSHISSMKEIKGW